MKETRKRLLAILALLLSPMAANADLIDVGGFQDWEFDFSALGAGDVTRWAYSATGEDRLAANAGIALEFGSGIGLSDLTRFIYVNRFDASIDNVSSPIFSLAVPSELNTLYARVSYVDDAFGFDNFRITFGGNILSGTRVASVPEPSTLALFGLGLLGLGFARRRV